MTPPPSAPGPADGGVRLAYRLEGPPVEVRVPASLAGAAAALFPDARSEPGAAAPEIELAARAEGGFDLRTPTGEARLPGGAAALAAYELALAETLVRRSGAVPLHAAGALLPDGGAVALVGDGGGGKSTLAAALARAGRPLYGDDVLLLEPGSGRVRAFPRLLKLLPPAPALLGLAPPRGPLARLWTDSALYHPGELGSSWAPPAPLRSILFLERDPAATRVERTPVPPREAVRRLLPQLQLVERPDAAGFEAVAEAVDGAETAVLRYASAPDAARTLTTGMA